MKLHQFLLSLRSLAAAGHRPTKTNGALRFAGGPHALPYCPIEMVAYMYGRPCHLIDSNKWTSAYRAAHYLGLQDDDARQIMQAADDWSLDVMDAHGTPYMIVFFGLSEASPDLVKTRKLARIRKIMLRVFGHFPAVRRSAYIQYIPYATPAPLLTPAPARVSAPAPVAPPAPAYIEDNDEAVVAQEAEELELVGAGV